MSDQKPPVPPAPQRPPQQQPGQAAQAAAAQSQSAQAATQRPPQGAGQTAATQQPPQQGRPQTPPQPRPAAAPKKDDKMEEERRESMRIASYGAQVILDYEGDAALAARGGAAGTITENTIIRDADLVELGHDPKSPSNDRLATRPNFMPGKGPEPKVRWIDEQGRRDEAGEIRSRA